MGRALLTIAVGAVVLTGILVIVALITLSAPYSLLLLLAGFFLWASYFIGKLILLEQGRRRK